MPTRIVGERFHIYASKKPAAGSGQLAEIWSRDLAMPDERLPAWMLELAEQMKPIPPGLELPRGGWNGDAEGGAGTQSASAFYMYESTCVHRAPSECPVKSAHKEVGKGRGG